MSTTSRSKAPLYHHIADIMRDDIRAGQYRRGDQLPSENALCERFGVSRITVRGALDRLAAEGLVRREQGRGTFVEDRSVEHSLIHLTDFVEDMVAAGLEPRSQVTHFADEPADDEVAVALRVSPTTIVTRLDRLRLADEQPIAFDVTYLPLRFSRLLDRERLATTTIFQQLEDDFGIPVVSGSFLIASASASSAIAGQLSLDEGESVLVIRRTSFSRNDEPIYYQVRSYRPDRVRYRIELRREHSTSNPRLTAFAPVFGSQRSNERFVTEVGRR